MKTKESKDIWDVIFSLDKSYFPLSRNYLQEPRGSSNPINSQVKMKPKKEYLEFASEQNPVDLYAIDLELNLLFRKLADFIFFGDKEDVSWGEDRPPFYEFLFAVNKKLEDVINTIKLSFQDMTSDAYSIAESHILYGENPSEQITEEMRNMAELQFAIQYFIENSDWDWRTKAEAFLRSHYSNDFEHADDETLIYLSKKMAKDKDELIPPQKLDLGYDFKKFDTRHNICAILNKETDKRWERCKNRWNIIKFDDNNAFEIKGDISSLRYFNWSYLNFINTLIYESESKHLLSHENMRNFCLMMTVFRTDLQVIKKQIYYIVELLKESLSKGEFKFGYNYTGRDRMFLLFLLYHYINGRLDKVSYDDDFIGTAKSLLFDVWKINRLKRNRSTLDFTSSASLLSLICFNVQAVWFSQIEGHSNYLDETFGKIIKEQNAYGYWFDFCNSPEFTTVLALDTLNIRSKEPSFPLNKIKLFKIKPDSTHTYLEYDAKTRILIVGNQKINLTASQWELFEEMVGAKHHDYPLKITKKYQDARRYLKGKLKNPKLINEIISTDRIGRKMRLYKFGQNVHIKNHPLIRVAYGHEPAT